MADVLTLSLSPILFYLIAENLCPFILIISSAIEYFIVIVSFEDEEVTDEDLSDLIDALAYIQLIYRLD